MELQDALQQLIQLELTKAQAAASEKAPVVQKAEESKSDAPVFDMDALVEKMTEALTPKVEELVQKALPELEREPGAGRAAGAAAGEPSATVAASEPKTIEELVAKAETGHQNLSEDEKKAIWALTNKVLSYGLSKTD